MNATVDIETLTNQNGTPRASFCFKVPPEVSYDITILLAVSSFIGIIGNITFIIIGLLHRVLRHSKPNKLLVQLAFAGLVYIIVKVPVAVDIDSNGGCFRYGLIGCKTFSFLITLSRALTIWTLVASSIHLVFDITRKSFQTADPSKTIAVVWIWCLILSVPSLFLARMYVDEYHCTSVPIEYDPQVGIVDKTPYYICHITWALLLYIIPLCFICGAYGFVSFKLVMSFRMLRNDQPQMKSMIDERKRVVRIFIGVTCLFALSWLPYYIFRLAVFSKSYASKLSKPSLISTVLFTCLYPWFIYCVSPPYRKGFRWMLGLAKVKPSRSTSSYVPSQSHITRDLNERETTVVTKVPNNSSPSSKVTSPVWMKWPMPV